MFIKTTVRELFFHGVRFDCSASDFAASAVCGALKEKEEILIPEGDSIYRFGYLAKVRIIVSVVLENITAYYESENDLIKISLFIISFSSAINYKNILLS